MADLTSPNELIELLKERRFDDIELMDYDPNTYAKYSYQFKFDKKIKISGHKKYVTIDMVFDGTFQVLHIRNESYYHHDNMTFDRLIVYLDHCELYKLPLIKKALTL